MFSKKLKIVLVMMLGCNVAGTQASFGSFVGKAVELPMKISLGAAMLYFGKKTHESACALATLNKMNSAKVVDIKILEEALKNLGTTATIIKDSYLKGKDPKNIESQYFVNTLCYGFGTFSLAYYFFFK